MGRCGAALPEHMTYIIYVNGTAGAREAVQDVPCTTYDHQLHRRQQRRQRVLGQQLMQGDQQRRRRLLWPEVRRR